MMFMPVYAYQRAQAGVRMYIIMCNITALYRSYEDARCE